MVSPLSTSAAIGPTVLKEASSSLLYAHTPLLDFYWLLSRVLNAHWPIWGHVFSSLDAALSCTCSCAANGNKEQGDARLSLARFMEQASGTGREGLEGLPQFSVSSCGLGISGAEQTDRLVETISSGDLNRLAQVIKIASFSSLKLRIF